MDKSLIKQTLKTQILEIVSLKYETFLKMIDELNSIAEYFLDDEGFHLKFKVAPGSDLTFFWKLTVRVQCYKCKNEDNITSVRLLNLNQLLNVYNTIKQQSETLKMFQPQLDSETSTTDATAAETSHQQQDKKQLEEATGSDEYASCSGELVAPSTSCSSTTNKNIPLKESRLFDMISSMTEIPNEDEICCICMEEKTNVILACTHNFCETCIKEWKISSNTCPICRKRTDESDCFILTGKPDYYNLQDEMSKSLFQITEKVDKKKKSGRSTRTAARTSQQQHDDDTFESESD